MRSNWQQHILHRVFKFLDILCRRTVFIDNMIELATMSGSLAGPTGIYLSSSQPFNQVVIRKNVIRDVQAGSGIVSDLSGINVTNCGELIAENNIISNAGTDKAVRFSNCASRKFFNNQNQAEQLLRAYDGTFSVGKT